MLTNPRIHATIAGRRCELAFDMAAAYWLERTHQLSFDKISAASVLLKTRQDKLEFVRKLAQAMTQSMAEPLTGREAQRLTPDDLVELATPIQVAIGEALNGLPTYSEQKDAEVAKGEALAWDWGRVQLEAADRLRMPPREFWRLTVAEYLVMLQAATRREEREARFTAAMVANVINHCSFGLKHPVTVEALLGRRAKERPKGRSFADMTPAEREKAWKQLLRRARRTKRAKSGEAKK